MAQNFKNPEIIRKYWREIQKRYRAKKKRTKSSRNMGRFNSVRRLLRDKDVRDLLLQIIRLIVESLKR